MGRERGDFQITYSVSRHNSEQDREDDQLVRSLRERLQDICDSEEFAPINPWIV